MREFISDYVLTSLALLTAGFLLIAFKEIFYASKAKKAKPVSGLNFNLGSSIMVFLAFSYFFLGYYLKRQDLNEVYSDARDCVIVQARIERAINTEFSIYANSHINSQDSLYSKLYKYYQENGQAIKVIQGTINSIKLKNQKLATKISSVELIESECNIIGDNSAEVTTIEHWKLYWYDKETNLVKGTFNSKIYQEYKLVKNKETSEWKISTEYYKKRQNESEEHPLVFPG